MGWGGSLIWSAVIAELHEAYPGKKFVFRHTIPTPLDRICPQAWKKTSFYRKINRRFFWETKPLDQVFNHSPKLVPGEILSKREIEDAIVIDSAAIRNSYALSCSEEKIIFKEGRAIEILCRAFGCQARRYQPELFLTDDEKRSAHVRLKNLKNFIAIEPHAKEDFTPNKSWLWERWQAVVDQLKDEVDIVQVGLGGKPLLKSVRDYRGVGSFRDAASLLSYASLFVGTDGGLMHAARAVGIDSVIIYGGYTRVALTAYENNINLYHHVACAPCGLKTPCPYDRKCLQAVSVKEVVGAIRVKLGRRMTAGVPQ